MQELRASHLGAYIFSKVIFFMEDLCQKTQRLTIILVRYEIIINTSVELEAISPFKHVSRLEQQKDLFILIRNVDGYPLHYQQDVFFHQ